MPRGGRRPGAGRKPKSATHHHLTGDAGKRKLAVVPGGKGGDVPSAPEVPPLVMPQDRLANEAEQAYWTLYQHQAQAAGTLTAQTLGGFLVLCQVSARADRLWEQVESEGFTLDGPSGPKAHPLLSQYRGLVQRQESLLRAFNLSAWAKPVEGAQKPPVSDEAQRLRELMSVV